MRTSLVSAAMALGCAAVVTARVVTAPGPTLARSATPAERADAAHTIVVNEHRWWNETAQNFPADAWSQRDDFHGHEYKKVLDIAREKQIRVEDVLEAIDDDIHHPGGSRASTYRVDAKIDRRANAVPCKPRPFYD